MALGESNDAGSELVIGVTASQYGGERKWSNICRARCYIGMSSIMFDQQQDSTGLRCRKSDGEGKDKNKVQGYVSWSMYER